MSDSSTAEYIVIPPPPHMKLDDYTKVIQFYGKWFPVDYTLPDPKKPICAGHHNSFRQAVLDGASAKGYEIPDLPDPVVPGVVIEPTRWNTPIKSN